MVWVWHDFHPTHKTSISIRCCRRCRKTETNSRNGRRQLPAFSRGEIDAETCYLSRKFALHCRMQDTEPPGMSRQPVTQRVAYCNYQKNTCRHPDPCVHVPFFPVGWLMLTFFSVTNHENSTCFTTFHNHSGYMARKPWNTNSNRKSHEKPTEATSGCNVDLFRISRDRSSPGALGSVAALAEGGARLCGKEDDSAVRSANPHIHSILCV